MVKFLFLFITVSFLGSTTWVANDIAGTWLNKDQDAHIKIYASYGKYYGQIIWLKIPNDPETGKPKLDKHNPDAALRTKPVMNLIILKNLEFDADDQEWDDGEVYDPKSGKDYSLTCSLKDKNTMELRGYMGISLLGRTDIWTRVTE
ncbi:DUF2147 domain-containing protein [soil metagenome]